jgi:ankyrin repeat protein
MIFGSKKAKFSFYSTLALCSGIYVTNAMEQEKPAPKKRKIEEPTISAIEEKREEQASSFVNLPSELKFYIINFLVNAENKEKAIENIKALAATSKEFYNFINDTQVLGSCIKEISTHFNIYCFNVALAFKNPGAANWLKDYAQKNCEMKEALDQRLLGTAKIRDKALAHFLLNAGADVDKEDKYDNTPLHEAVYQGHKDIVELLLAYGADVNKAAKVSGCSPLFPAVAYGHKDIVELLIEAGADVNMRDKTEYTPLNSASYQGHKEIAELLLNAGADVNQAENDGKAPMHRAAGQGFKEIVELLLNARAAVNQADNDGNTPLSLAVRWGYKEIVELLLNARADANQADNDGNTPLSLAVRWGHKEIVELLVNARADANKANKR